MNDRLRKLKAQPSLAICHGDDAVSGVFEDPTQDAPDGSVILDDCHAGARTAPVGSVLQAISLRCATTT